MPHVFIAGTDLKVSRFIFGTASLFNAGHSKVRARLLIAAVEEGFTHFDTAPLYGFGMAERDLAPLLRQHPEITVTTKVGLYAPGGHNSGAAAITMRKAIGRFIPKMSAAIADYSVTAARKSLEGSLRRLGRPHVDFLLIHEPDYYLMQTDEWCRWLEDEVKAGKVGAFGAAGTVDRLKPHFRVKLPLLKVIQMEDSLDRREVDTASEAGFLPQITYGYVSAARARGDIRPVAEVLHAALQLQIHGAVIVSTTRLERIGQYGAIANGEI